MNFILQISSHLFDFCWKLWQCDVQAILQGFSTLTNSCNSNAIEQHQEELYLKCERWLLCLKIIRQLVIFGFPSDAKSVKVNSVLFFPQNVFFFFFKETRTLLKMRLSRKDFPQNVYHRQFSATSLFL